MRRSIAGGMPRRLATSKLCWPTAKKHRGSRLHLSSLSNPDPLYQHIDDVEKLDRYRPGGYHPIQVGDKLRDRYCVVHKLGHGSYSTIWLAQHEIANKYVAVKVGTADAGAKEAEVLKQLAAATGSHGQFGHHLIPAPLDLFDLAGPNGIHTCSVTRPARCSVLDASSEPFQLPVARSIAAQLAIAVAYMHQSGHVHGGAWLLSMQSR